MARAVALAACLLIATGCGSGKGPSRDQAVRQAEALLSQRDYSGAIAYLEEALAREPGDPQLVSLLANAHMGRAGFELLPFVKRVLAVQDTTPLDIAGEPECDTSAMSDLEELDLTCFLYRVARNLPAADHPDILRAQSLYRQYFPNPASTSNQINFSAGLVEMLSALARGRALLDRQTVAKIEHGLYVDPTQFPFETFIRHSKRGMDDFNRGLERFRNSYGQLESLVKSLNGKTILTVDGHDLVFNRQLTTGSIVRFMAFVSRNRTQQLDEMLSRIATEQLHLLGAGAARILNAADPFHFLIRTGPDGAPQLGINTGDAVTTLLFLLADSMDKQVKVSLFELAWSNPPPIVSAFFEATNSAWDAESGDPMRAYFADTRDEWLELKDIVNDWNRWIGEDMSDETRTIVLGRIATDADSVGAGGGGGGGGNSGTQLAMRLGPFRAAASVLEPPTSLPSVPQLPTPPPVPSTPSTPAVPQPPAAPETPRPPNYFGELPSFEEWIGDLGGFLGFELEELTAPRSPDNPSPLLPAQIQQALILMERTDSWMTRNFYPISAWTTLEPLQQ